jgi:hypothetical protein
MSANSNRYKEAIAVRNYAKSLPLRKVLSSVPSYNNRSIDALDCGHVLEGCNGMATQRRCWKCGPVEEGK